MNGIMHGAIGNITQHKTRKKCQSIPAHNQVKEAEKQRRCNDTWNRRHKQTLPVTRILMMHPMHGVSDPFYPGIFRGHMKYKTMQNIFQERPDKDTSYKNPGYSAPG